MQEIQQGNTTQVIYILLVSSADHRTGLTGASPAVTISKNGGGFGSVSGAVTELANGLYVLAADADDADTLGPCMVHVVAASADPVDIGLWVVKYDPLNTPYDTYARLLTFGRTVTYTGPVSTAGDVTLRRGDAYAAAHGSNLPWSSTGWEVLTGGTLELIDSATGTAIGTASHSTNGDTQTVSVDLTAAQSLALADGQREYILRVKWSGEPVELASGNLIVLEG